MRAPRSKALLGLGGRGVVKRSPAGYPLLPRNRMDYNLLAGVALGWGCVGLSGLRKNRDDSHTSEPGMLLPGRLTRQSKCRRTGGGKVIFSLRRL